ncbi:LOW QUALITY PROTEIN: Trna-specific adenosine deaminase-like protein 3 protein [Gryllus bimaculatus]|nr:LOW QUALITY PROTEIN: Trna-specific adenosine deaminase-like protein 3 protein [Gryllus bimaculatus]
MSDTTSYDAANESDGWHIEAVLGPEYSEPVRTVDAVVDVVVDRRHTSRLVQDLQRLCPIPSLRHLKRVCPDGRILIQLATDSPGHEGSDSDKNSSRTSKCSPLPQECKNKRSFSETVTDSDSGPQDGSTSSEQLYSTSKSVLLDEQKNERALPRGLDASGLRGRPERCAVPASPPLTRAQFTHAQRLWSCNFHPAKSAAAAVHPHDGSLVALAVDARDEHPLQHAAMRLVDLVARTQCGGVWTPLPKEEIKKGRTGYRAGADQKLKVKKGKARKHTTMKMKGTKRTYGEMEQQIATLQIARSETEDSASSQQGNDGGKILRIARAPTAKKIEESVSNASGKDSLPYLCTGLDVVMTHEPCAMCAMALTHARTRCVFFSEDNSNCGVLYSHSPPLQILPGLNHRLQVFHAYLPEGKR